MRHQRTMRCLPSQVCTTDFQSVECFNGLEVRRTFGLWHNRAITYSVITSNMEPKFHESRITKQSLSGQRRSQGHR